MAATVTWIVLSYLAGALATYGLLAGRVLAGGGRSQAPSAAELRRWSDEVSDAVRK